MSQAITNRPRTPTELQPMYALVRNELDEVENILRDQLHSKNPFIDSLTKHGFRLGGKRLRPALLLLSGKACGTLGREHPPLATAVEMIHTATLIHDDVLDEATLRRHLDTVNARWDNEASVLLGDYLFTLSICLVSSLDDTFACRTIGEVGKTMCAGELRQVGSRGNYRLSEEDYLTIIGDKTAALYACCCRLGAHYAGANPEVREAFGRFGYHLGVAFQIIDDVLDLLGDESKAGKSLGTDLLKQKPTLPVIRLLDQADDESRAKVVAVLSGSGDSHRDALQPWLERSDAISYAQAKALWYARRATEELEALPATAARDALVQIADFVITRQH